jgi:thiamine-triphosphatase
MVIRPVPIILEVERKFVSLAVSKLNRDSGVPPFKSLLRLPTRTVQDTYYDTSTSKLSKAGTWVRRRNSLWEAKVRQGGDFVNSRFKEFSGAGAVAGHVRQITGMSTSPDDTPKAGEELAAFGLVPVAGFTTTRETWLADEEFRIVRDSMDFGHEVGEVELLAMMEKVPSEHEKQARLQEMDERIAEFMRRYSWAFKEGTPVGKLTAYFELMGRNIC